MDDEMAARVLAEHVNRLVSAKMGAISGLISGLELSIVHMFNLLDRRGVLTKAEALRSLIETREGLPEAAPAATGLVLRQLERALKGLLEQEAAEHRPNPADLRSRFRVIPGGLSEEPPAGTDRNE